MVNRFTFFTILLPVMMFCNSLKAQTVELINSSELLDQGVKLHDDGKYTEAIELYKKIGRNDTNYFLALVELANSFYMLDQYDSAIKYCRIGLKLKSTEDINLYNSLASSLDDLKLPDSAIKIYDQALKEYPKEYLLWFNKGIVLRKMKKIDEAIRCFQKVVDLNIYYTSAHYQLGTLCAKNNLYPQAMLSLTMYLVLNPSGSRSKDVIDLLESISNGSYEPENDEKATIDLESDNFSDIDAIIKAKNALSSKYKTKIKIPDPYVKQLQLLLEQITYEPSRNGFWSRTYTRFFKTLYEKKYIDALTYYVFSNVNDSRVQKWLKGNKAKINGFTNLAVEILSDQMQNKTILTNGSEQVVKHWYYKDHHVSAIGNTEKNNRDEYRSGHWIYYYPNGIVKNEGDYADNGNKTGVWKIYYPSGHLNEISNYSNDSLVGKSLIYYDNGKLQYELNFKNNELQGELRTYYATGQLKTNGQADKGKRNGYQNFYYLNGDRQYELYNKDGEPDSIEIDYYLHGKISSITHFKNKKKDGEYISYAKNGTVDAQGSYKNDLKVGDWKYYYNSGKLKKQVHFDDKGLVEGTITEYYENGNISFTNDFVNGKMEGQYKEYEEDGILYYTMTYSKDRLNKMTFYDKKGNVISEIYRKKDKIDCKFVFPDGKVKTTGVYDVDDAKLGEWKYYYHNGQLKSVENYKNGELEGKGLEYYKNGQVQEVVNYKKGERNGLYKSYYANGVLQSTGWYVKGNREGEWYDYYPDGNLSSHEYYLHGELYGYQEDYHFNGKKNYEYYISDDYIHFYVFYDTLGNIVDSCVIPYGTGPLKTYAYNGKLVGSANIKNGKIEGDFTWYYPDGKVATKTVYDFNEKNGPYKSYFENGKVSSEGTYTQGTKTGVWKYYYENGRLQSSGTYDQDGDRTGEWIWYNENGNKTIVKNFEEGLEEGEALYYSENGAIQQKKFYHEGEYLAYSYLDKNGNFVPPVTLENESGKVTTFYQDGNKALEYTVTQGFYEGEYTAYFPNGKIDCQKMYKYDELEGVSKEYYPDGKLKSEISYTYGNNNGPARYYTPAGKPDRTEFYTGDVRHGDWLYFDANGKVKKTVKYRYGYILQ